MPSTRQSVVSTWNAPRSGAATAASSPMPTTSAGGAGGTRRRMRSMRPRSPASETRGPSLPGKLNRPGLPDHRDLDLPGVLELVLDPAGDVLRQPDRLLVRDLFALDHDPDLAAGLQGEGLGDAGE